MAENKKSFILYSDFKEVFNELSDQDAGQLIKHIFQYVNDENPTTENPIVKISFIPIKNQLKRDLKDWEEIRQERSKAGKIGGIKSGESRQSKQTKQVLQTGSKTKQTQANEAVTANVTVNVNDNVTERGNTGHTQFLKSIVYNAEETILKNEIEFQRICAGAGIDYDVGKLALHKYHLHLEEKEQYPKGKRSVFAGFEKWMANEKNFINNRKNGTHQQPNRSGVKAGSKSAGAHNLLESLREDFKRSG